MPASSFDFARLANSMLFTGEDFRPGIHAHLCTRLPGGRTILQLFDRPHGWISWILSAWRDSGCRDSRGIFEREPHGCRRCLRRGHLTAMSLDAGNPPRPRRHHACPCRRSGFAAPSRRRSPSAHRGPLRPILGFPRLHLLEQEVIETFLGAFRAGLEHLLPPPLPRVVRRETSPAGGARDDRGAPRCTDFHPRHRRHRRPLHPCARVSLPRFPRPHPALYLRKPPPPRRPPGAAPVRKPARSGQGSRHRPRLLASRSLRERLPFVLR